MNDVLKDLVDVNQFAADLGRHPRTIFRWTELEDGLPFVKLGKTRLIHLPSAREWIMSRMRRRNPNRRRRRSR
jgi:hypothetical protein